jgi:hypothetical protein
VLAQPPEEAGSTEAQALEAEVRAAGVPQKQQRATTELPRRQSANAALEEANVASTNTPKRGMRAKAGLYGAWFYQM